MNTGVTAREVEDLLARTTWPGATGDCAGVGELADRFAAGFVPGSVVLVALPNGTRLIRVFFALVLAGLVPTLLAASTPASRLRATARRLGATALVRPGGETDQVTVTRLDDTSVRTHRPGQAILLTSGTSGMATGCLHDVAALRRNATRHARSIGLGPADRMLITLPMHYSYALVAQVIAGLVTGASLVVTGPPFTPAGYRDVVTAHDVTVSALTPLLVADLQADGGRLPRGLRALGVGGHALDPARTARLLAANPDLELYLTYGLTEAGPRVSTLAAHREPPARYASAGTPIDGVRLGLRDAGRGPDEQEVLVTADTVYRAKVGVEGGVSRGKLVAADTIATGDVGRLDDDGYLWLSGRISDFAIVRGDKVSLSSVRKAAESLDGVLRAIVTPPADENAGALELALYVDETRTLSEKDVRRTLYPLLTPNERPGELTVHPVTAGSLHK
ncbi:long-chain fatty acid--CoA ligase [Amycolatopsis sp. NBC_00355]|uniref:class I adenylate-forming enzyme family protein n=1 Tax=Amycolatopsis sp. NBC_00355 TaxID=2975957 RepID=UPI002E2597B8